MLRHSIRKTKKNMNFSAHSMNPNIPEQRLNVCFVPHSFYFVIFPLLLQTSVSTSSTLIISNMSLCWFNMDCSRTNRKKTHTSERTIGTQRNKSEIFCFFFCNFSHLLKGPCINAMVAHGQSRGGRWFLRWWWCRRDHFKCMLRYMICFSFSARFHFMSIAKREKKIRVFDLRKAQKRNKKKNRAPNEYYSERMPVCSLHLSSCFLHRLNAETNRKELNWYDRKEDEEEEGTEVEVEEKHWQGDARTNGNRNQCE